MRILTDIVRFFGSRKTKERFSKSPGAIVPGDMVVITASRHKWDGKVGIVDEIYPHPMCRRGAMLYQVCYMGKREEFSLGEISKRMNLMAVVDETHLDWVCTQGKRKGERRKGGES